MFGSGILPDRHTLTLSMLLIVTLVWVSFKDSILFLCLIETVTLLVTWGVFIIAWNSRGLVHNGFLLFLGIDYLFVGIIDLLHMISHTGTGVFAANSTNLALQLWVIARFFQSGALFVAPFLLGKKIKTAPVFAAFALIAAVLLLSVFRWNNFPACFIEGIGPTRFWKISEYEITIFLIGAVFTLSLKRQAFEFTNFWVLVSSLALSILAESAFAFSTDIHGHANFISHFLRVIAVYLIYRVFIQAGISAPYNTIYRNLSLSEKNLFSLLEGLPAFVFVQMPDYTIQYANRVFRDMFGDPNGKTCHQVLVGKDYPCEFCPTQEVLRTGNPQQRDWNLIRDRTFAIYEYPYRDVDSSPAVLKLGIDITDRKNIETELVEARNELENRVEERTAELTRINEVLRLEIAEKERVQQNLRKSEEELRHLSLKLLQAQEMERRRIAMELHDGLGGSLSAIKFRTENAICQLEMSPASRPGDLFGEIIPMLQNLMEEVRRIHSNIWPSILGDFGLIAALNWQCRVFEQNYPHIHIEKSLLLEESETPDILKIVVYRIIQEALNNIAKHSGADSVSIRLNKQYDSIELKICDNGKGFDVSKAQESARTSACFGLSSMRERARLAGGSLRIRSEGNGTEISATWREAMISNQQAEES